MTCDSIEACEPAVPLRLSSVWLPELLPELLLGEVGAAWGADCFLALAVAAAASSDELLAFDPDRNFRQAFLALAATS